MLMKYICRTLAFVFLVFSLLFVACHRSGQSDAFTLSGMVVGDNLPQEAILSYDTEGGSVSDTAVVQPDGKFRFEGKLSQPSFAILSINNVNLWLEPTDMTIEIDLSTSKVHVEGSRTHKDQEAYFSTIDSVIGSFRPLSDSLQQAIRALSTVSDRDRAQLEARIDSLQALFTAREPNTTDLQTRFILRHPSSHFSSYLLYPLVAGEGLSPERAESLYHCLSDSVQRGLFGKRIESVLSLQQKCRVGVPAPAFKAFDPIHSQELQLSDLKGKVVLLDFWAPWCSPCRMGFPHLKQMYEKYHDQGLEIVAVYTDKKSDEEKWTKAIDEEGIRDFHHVKIAEDMSAAEGSPDDLRSGYYVQAIPRKVLIDRDGKIVKYWVGYSPKLDEEVEQYVRERLTS